MTNQVLLELLKENLGEIRHTENHRNNISGIILVVVGFVGGTLDKSDSYEIMAGVLIFLLGIFGILIIRKLYERQKWYMGRVSKIYERLDHNISDLNIMNTYLSHESEHKSTFNKLSRIRMNVLWMLLFVGITIFGLSIIIIGVISFII